MEVSRRGGTSRSGGNPYSVRVLKGVLYCEAWEGSLLETVRTRPRHDIEKRKSSFCTRICVAFLSDSAKARSVLRCAKLSL
jgi:hypothetical protein